jgi:SnoaL-like domain
MSSSEALATVRKLFQAVAHRDAAGYFAAYHPNSVISEAPSLPYGGDYSGPEGVKQHAEAFRCTWDRYQPEDSRDLEPEFLATAWSCCGGSERRGREENSVDLPAVSIYRLRDGRPSSVGLLTKP